MIRTLLFDIGEVLIGLDMDALYQAASRVSPYGPHEIEHKIDQMQLARPYELGFISSQEFYERCRAGLELRVDYQGFREIWGAMLNPEPLVATSWLRDLASRYRLVALSNTNELHIEWVRERFTVLEPFSGFAFSHMAGSMKPDRRIYEAALEAADCAAEECFFVDDKVENVEGAKRLGIRAEQTTSTAHLKRLIASLDNEREGRIAEG